MYERQDGSGLEIGSYAHRPILHDARRHPLDRGGGAVADRAAVHPGRLRPAAGARARADARDRRRRDRRREVRDQRAALAHARRHADARRDARGAKGLWSAAAVWIKEGPGVGKSSPSGWSHGESRDRPPRLRHRPLLHAPEDARTTSRARAAEGFNKTYGIVHPARAVGVATAASASRRSTRASEALGAVFFEAAGWERPQWYESNAPLLEEYGDRVTPREAEWDARWWSPIINAEHLAMRERAAMVDLTAFAIFDVIGPGALDCLQRRRRAPDGRRRSGASSTRRCSTPSGGFRPT